MKEREGSQGGGGRGSWGNEEGSEPSQSDMQRGIVNPDSQTAFFSFPSCINVYTVCSMWSDATFFLFFLMNPASAPVQAWGDRNYFFYFYFFQLFLIGHTSAESRNFYFYFFFFHLQLQLLIICERTKEMPRYTISGTTYLFITRRSVRLRVWEREGKSVELGIRR